MSLKSLRHHFLHFPWKAFGLLLLVLYFGHWLGAAVMHHIDSASGHFPHHHPWVTAILSGLILTGLVFCLHTLHHRNPRPNALRLRGLLWFLSTLTVIFAYCAATWTEHALLGLFPFLKSLPIVFILLCLLGLAAVNRVLKNVLRAIEGPEDIILTGKPEIPPRVLVLFVSLNSAQNFTFAESGSFAVVTTGPHGKEPTEYRLSGESLEDDIESLDGSRWPWQQLLRAILPHRELKKIIIVGSKYGFSKTTPGSYGQLADCQRLISRYAPEGCEVIPYPDALPFEGFNLVKKTLREIIGAELPRAGEGGVAIDVTGGQATTSIAAAAATIGTEAIFQYVQTNPPCEVLYYDVHNFHAPSPHGH